MEGIKIYDGDIELSGVGRPVTFTGKDKLSQLIREVLLIDTDDRGFGASLGQSGFDVVAEIYETMTRLKKLQNKSKYKREDTELYKGIQRLDVTDRSKTKVKFELVVLSQASEEVVLEV